MSANLMGVSERCVSALSVAVEREGERKWERKREREGAIERESAREREIARASARDAGIGIRFAMQPVQGRLRLVIADIDPGGPAASCGHIGVGDEIVEINKRNCAKWNVGDICAQVTGTAGSCADLLVIRQGSGEKIEVNLKRGYVSSLDAIYSQPALLFSLRFLRT
jgi:C-terminal processing protease CtpA/Prc